MQNEMQSNKIDRNAQVAPPGD